MIALLQYRANHGTERVTGDLRGFIEGTHSSDYDAVRVQLFDAYMTPGDHAPYQADRKLLGFRRFFGPERRDILMLWRNRLEVIFAKHHGREPGGVERLEPVSIANTMVSRCRSTVGETCEYYMRHFRFDTCGRKWRDRKGRAIHTQSDFMRPLYEWGETLFANAVKM
jgi:hypothetical protein